ncbi:MAG TPA: molybdopterin cofactor-binding domain-containing protein [Thermoanaerobaculia bacterium]|nr:molybdopterin cofactor-binding domain-containing protein [Thermoanaerobaculia bacterium]
MTDSMPISRRTFIASAALAAGGALAIGLRYMPWGRMAEPSGSVEVFNWIVVAPDDTITIRIAQMEMGQGTMTAMAQLLAEELEADWSKVKTELISIATHLRRGRIYGRTTTAGSEGVSRSQMLLRTSGAQIRTMFVRAAAKRLGVNESELVAKNSVVTHTSTGRRLTYGELAADAADVPVPDPDSVELKDPSEWRTIGASVDRVDLPGKVDGSATYGIDVEVPGMKHAAIAMSPVFGGRLVAHDAQAALGRPGVQRVVVLPDAGAVAVVADEWWQARSAIDAMKVIWDEGTWASVDSAAIRAGLMEGFEGPPDRSLRNDGDVEGAIASAARTLEADYFTPYLEHAALEPMNCTALVTRRRFEVWAPTQVPEFAMETAAEAAGMAAGRGILHVTQIGGGFGRRQETDFVAQAVQIARAMRGTPVKLLWSREDTMQHGFYRPASLSRIRAALDGEGNITAWWHRIAAPSTDEVRNRFGSDSLLYAIPNMRVELVSRSSHVPEGQMRGVGFSIHGFVTQSALDELARAAGRDPYELQRTLLDPEKTPAIVPTATLEGQITHDLRPRERAARLRAVLDEVAGKSGWGSPLGPGRGRGLAVQEQADAFYAVVVEVTLDGKGWFRVDRVVVAGDPSFLVNPRNAEAQVEGSVAFGLTSAMYGEITIDRGRVAQSNFHDYPMLRIREMPKVETHWVLSRQPGWGGVGEPVVSAVIPALTNAIYDAGGPRIRSLPIRNHEISVEGGRARG